MVQVIESQSVWRFEDLLKKTVRDVINLNKKFPDNEEMIEKRLLDFLKKLPNLDIDKEIKEYWSD